MLIGLSGVGKTYFLDSLQNNKEYSRTPTKGWYEIHTKHEKHDFHIIEYGYSMPWDTIMHNFDALYVMINAKSPIEELLDIKSQMLVTIEKMKCACLVIILVGEEGDKYDIAAQLQLNYIVKYNTHKAIASINYNKDEWVESVSRILRWTIKNIK